MSETYQTPRSPRDETGDMFYFPRLCDKVRLHASGNLAPCYQGNLGGGMDLWTSQFLGVDYEELAAQIRSGKSDEEALAWARENGTPRSECEVMWWKSFMRNRGFRDDLSERLVLRKAESGLADRDDVRSFMDYIDADEGRI